MKIITLMENELGSVPMKTEKEPGCLAEHGLSLYIETPKHKLLLDTGASDAFLNNAAYLGVDLKEVDTFVLSHGHYDHSGGILAFAECNPNAALYLQNKANLEFYHKTDIDEHYIGIAPAISLLPQLKWVESDLIIDDELSIFSGVKGRTLWPAGNKELMQKIIDEKGNTDYIQDEFEHEQYLVITCEGKKVLLSGCAHNGVINILERYQQLYGEAPDVMISGFHMMKDTEYTKDEVADIKATAEICKSMKTKFYTGHCTGIPAYEIMKEIMGEQLQILHTGDEIIL